MQKPVVCHEENAALLDALASCLSTGLVVLIDGIPQTGGMLQEALKYGRAEGLVGHFLQNERGDIRGLSFTQRSQR